MPKKSRRARVKYRNTGKPSNVVTSKAVEQSSQVEKPNQAMQMSPPSTSSKSSGHRYVISELRRIGIIAIVLIIIIIVLTFILN